MCYPDVLSIHTWEASLRCPRQMTVSPFCVRTLWGQDNWKPAMVYLPFSGYCFKRILAWSFRNCPITACVASGKASVSGLASLLKEDGTFLAVFCSRCNFRAKTRFQTLATQATQNMHFFILTNRLLKIYTFLLPSQRWRK